MPSMLNQAFIKWIMDFRYIDGIKLIIRLGYSLSAQKFHRNSVGVSVVNSGLNGLSRDWFVINCIWEMNGAGEECIDNEKLYITENKE